MKNILNLFRFLFSLLLIGSWCSSIMAAPVNIIGFRASAMGENSRLVFEMSAKTEFKLFTLANPNRLVLDLKNSRLTGPLSKLSLVHTPIKDFRTRANKNGYLRIVMDLSNPVKVKSFIMPPSKPYKYRLVIDLAATASVPHKANISSHNSRAAQLPVAQLPLPTKATPEPVTPVAIVTSPRPRSTRDIIIVIDPGHGGKDPGTTGQYGTKEKDVVLAISKYLQQALNNEPGFHAELTRTSDYYIPLRGRLDIARKDKADMFIAIHADAYKNNNAMGASVFALSERGATSEAAHWLAEKENKSELLGGANLSNQDNILRSVLIDLSQTHTIGESLQIGSSILRQLSNVCVLHYARVEQAAFVVLKSPDIPSVLVETGFLSTPQQERQLRNPQYQKQIANSIMIGIKSYFVHNPPPQTSLAANSYR